VSVYVLVAIVKKRLNLDASLYTLLQILSVIFFEKMALQLAFTTPASIGNHSKSCSQLFLLDI
jgi:hypothetical protein